MSENICLSHDDHQRLQDLGVIGQWLLKYEVTRGTERGEYCQFPETPSYNT